jgi:hypothetical protein
MLARKETIRSKTPEGVRQEIRGIAIAYNLVRLELERAADEAGIEPSRITFVYALSSSAPSGSGRARHVPPSATSLGIWPPCARRIPMISTTRAA